MVGRCSGKSATRHIFVLLRFEWQYICTYDDIKVMMGFSLLLFSGYAYSFTSQPEQISIMRKWEGQYCHCRRHQHHHCHRHRLNLTMVGSDLNSFLTVFKATDRPILSVTWMINDQTNYDDDIDYQQLMLIMMISIWFFPLFRCLWW